MMTSRKLLRRPNRGIALGVCAGIADFFGWDVGVVRVAWVLLTIAGGSGILLYLAAAILMSTGE